jgi:hypothetical protein
MKKETSLMSQYFFGVSAVFSFCLIFSGVIFVTPKSVAAQTITAGAYAWGDVMGWVRFDCTNCNVAVGSSTITGYAWSPNYGWISLAPTQSGVLNDGNGHLSGFAWASQLGWIDFAGVTINAQGKFIGIAGSSSATAGRISFDCDNCSVYTTWLPPSAPIDENSGGSGSNSSGQSSSRSGSSHSNSLWQYVASFFGGSTSTVTNNPEIIDEPIVSNIRNTPILSTGTTSSVISDRSLPGYRGTSSTSTSLDESSVRYWGMSQMAFLSSLSFIILIIIGIALYVFRKIV